MGYTTQFSGRLLFNDPPVSAIQKLKTILGKDCREHPEWGRPDLTYIDLKVTDELDGLEWNESEKTYDLVEKVNLVIRLMKEEYPDFELTGELLAQGESAGDIWKLKMDSNIAREIPLITNDEKCYIVVEESWEYNDSYYHQPEDEGYTLVEPKLYTKEEAERICAEKNSKKDSDWFVTEENEPIQPFKIIKLEI